MPQDQINVDCITNAPIASPRSLIVTEANEGIESAITQAQGKARTEAKENDKIWGKVAKAVDIAMVVEPPNRIDRDQVKHIINAILEYASPKPQWKSSTQPDFQD